MVRPTLLWPRIRWISHVSFSICRQCDHLLPEGHHLPEEEVPEQRRHPDGPRAAIQEPLTREDLRLRREQASSRVLPTR